MNITNNNTSANIASAFQFRADKHASDGKNESRTTDARISSYRMAARDFEDAATWFAAAKGQTIGHTKRGRYEDAANHCLDQAELNKVYADTLKLDGGDA